MVMTLPKLRRPTRADLPLDRIKLPDLPDRAEIAQRMRVPELPDLPDIDLSGLRDIDLSGLPRRFPWRRRRAGGWAAGITPALATLLAIVLSGIVGALAAYFFDPDRGKERRLEAKNRLAGLRRVDLSSIGRLPGRTTSTEGSVTPIAEIGSLNGDITPPDGTIDELVPANPGL